MDFRYARIGILPIFHLSYDNPSSLIAQITITKRYYDYHMITNYAALPSEACSVRSSHCADFSQSPPGSTYRLKTFPTTQDPSLILGQSQRDSQTSSTPRWAVPYRDGLNYQEKRTRDLRLLSPHDTIYRRGSIKPSRESLIAVGQQSARQRLGQTIQLYKTAPCQELCEILFSCKSRSPHFWVIRLAKKARKMDGSCQPLCFIIGLRCLPQKYNFQRMALFNDNLIISLSFL